jgi:hypothetical protein
MPRPGTNGVAAVILGESLTRERITIGLCVRIGLQRDTTCELPDVRRWPLERIDSRLHRGGGRHACHFSSEIEAPS